MRFIFYPIFSNIRLLASVDALPNDKSYIEQPSMLS